LRFVQEQADEKTAADHEAVVALAQVAFEIKVARRVAGPAHAADRFVMAQTPPFSCNGCKDGIEQPFPFSMAFQPIVDVDTGKAFAYEALVRGERGEPVGSILGQVTKANRYAFDQSCRVKAISLATQLGLADTGAQLSINFMPGAVYSPAACIQLTLATAREVGFPCNQIIFEITEEEVVDRAHIRAIVEDYRQRGSRSLWMTSVRATVASTCWPISRPTSSSSIWI
jgi:EAL domain-containing protein (putative c-di-GMP-specific phosphodiesterase class I)